MTRGERSLAEIIAHERVAGRDLETIKKLARQIAEDLQILHAAGLVQGDIKPNNLLSEQGSRALNLIDFDASAQLGGSNDSVGAYVEEMIDACAEEMIGARLFRDMETAPWACTVCTFVNDSKISVCEMCGTAIERWDWRDENAKRCTVGHKAEGSSA